MLTSVLFVLTLAVAAANEEALQQFTSGNKQFSADIYKALAAKSKHKNFLVCPFSAETILALAQAGAKDKTGEEIRKALKLPNTTKDINSVFKTVLPLLKKNDAYSFHTANKIYIKNNYPIKEEFSSVATEVYQSSVENIDLSKPVKAAKRMNDWVSQQTNDKIHDLIDSKVLSDDTVAVLINALYFKGEWRKQFKKTLTKKRSFYKTEDDVVEVDTMKKSDYFGYYKSEELGATFLEMPFKGGRNVHLVIVLPDAKEGLKALEAQIGEVFTAPKFTWDFVEVSLPKFKIEASIDFKKILRKLGVKKAFTRADFSGMAGEKGELHISNVMQKTFIGIDENGVEAAASTAVLFHPKSLMEFAGEKKIFTADHPFLFYIKFNDIIIFTGRVVSPRL